MSFHLVKWYLDVVADDGTTFIAYVGRVSWHLLRASFAATLVAASDRAVIERATMRRVRLPAREHDILRWHSVPLAIQGSWTGRSAPMRRALFTSPQGSIGWSCVMPAAEASVHCAGVHIRGLGYVERLRLTLPPWQLPFDTLRWGRFLSPAHALVWIDWAGSVTQRWVWLDGVAIPDREGMLTLDPGVTIRRSHVLSTVNQLLPNIARRLPPALSRIHEQKTLSRGVLHVKGGESGWAIHETVTWSRDSPVS